MSIGLLHLQELLLTLVLLEAVLGQQNSMFKICQ